MNKMIITLSILLMAVACGKKKQAESLPLKMVVLSDHSNVMPIYPNTKWFENLHDWENIQKVNIQLEQLNDLPFHSVKHLNLKLETGLLSNDLENKKQLKDFHHHFKILLPWLTNKKKSSPKSVLFPILAKYLNQNVDYVYLFSDLKENSFIELHRYNTVKKLEQNKATILKKFNAIPIKKGQTKIYIYYKAKDYWDGLYIQALISIYREVLQPKGYEVILGELVESQPKN